MAPSLARRFSQMLSANMIRNALVSRLNATTVSTLYLSRNLSSSSSDTVPPASSDEVRDPFPVYSQSQVQSLLSRMTGFDLLKVAGPQVVPLQKPSYQLLTDEELAKNQQEAKDRLQYRLEMPPYMKARLPAKQVLVEDPELSGHDTSKFVFVDISFGVKDRKRNVVVREPDGNLYAATWDVKERMSQIYNPREGRHVITPAMFEEQHLERMLSEGRYLYILDRACCQFEPDDPDYIRVTRRTYNKVNTAKAFEVLRSTRHFGPLAFYLAWNKMMDSLLVDMLNRDLQSDARDLVHLFSLIHPDSECAKGLPELTDQSQYTDVVKVYLTTDCQQKDRVELALQGAMDSNSHPSGQAEQGS